MKYYTEYVNINDISTCVSNLYVIPDSDCLLNSLQ